MDTLVQEVRALKERLLAKSAAELRDLPARIDEASGKPRRSIAIWSDDLDDGVRRIVVQGRDAGWLGAGSVYAEGFRLNRDGLIGGLEEEELWEFI